MRKLVFATVSALALAAGSAAYADSFNNGGFETGDTSGWLRGGGYRASEYNPALSPSQFLPGGTLYDPSIASGHTEVVGKSYVDPNVGAALGSTVYSGNYSARVEDTTYGGYASVLTQTVKGYSDPNIFFAWKAVLDGAHGATDAATMIISLKDLKTGAELVHREYNAASGGSGVDPRFTFDGTSFYTANWQIEQLSVGNSLGDDLELSILAADCQPTGHWGYIYLDGIGNVTPPPILGGAVPEPASWAMMIGGMGMVGATMRRKKKTLAFAS